MLVGLGVCLLVLELGIRAYSAVAFPRMMQLDDVLGWKHSPGVRRAFVNEHGESVTVTQDAWGLRGSGHDLNRARSKFRVLVLGDSFTEAVHVGDDEVFTGLLERADPRLEVLNAGVGGYGTVQEYLYLLTEGLRLEPNVVLVMFYENDLSDNCLSYSPGFGPRPYATFQSGAVQLVRELESRDFARFALPVPFLETLNRHSYLYAFVNTRVYQKLFARRMQTLSQIDLRRTDNCGRYEIFQHVIGLTSQLAASRGARFAVVLIPSADDVARGVSPVQTPILEACQRAGLTCLSLFDRFRKESTSGAKLYFPVDIHWNRDGHRVATDEIRTRLERVLTP
jgi:lysophospholipase L1-like esterase